MHETEGGRRPKTSNSAAMRNPVGPAITAQSLSRRFIGRGETVQAVQDATLSVAAGELVAILGRSGAGKSTLLQLLAGLLRPSAGSARILGVEVESASDRALVRLRREHVAIVPQDFGLLDALTAAENVEVPIRLQRGDPAARGERVAAALAAVGLSEGARQRPSELSGGQQQRVAIARALVRDCAVLLADEPTGSLDSATATTVTEALHERARERGVAVLVTTHDPIVVAYADRVLRMHDGTIEPG